MNETIFHRPVPDAPCFCVGHDGHDPECACAEGGTKVNQMPPESRASTNLEGGPKARPEDCKFVSVSAFQNAANSLTRPERITNLQFEYWKAGARAAIRALNRAMLAVPLVDKTPVLQRFGCAEIDATWIWSDDELPPVNVPVLRIDPDYVDNLGQAEIVTRAGGIENNKGWVERPAWWMRIPPVSRASS